MKISDYNPEGFFALKLVGVKLGVLLSIKKFNNLTVVIGEVGLHFEVFFNSFKGEPVFTNEVNECLT